MKWKDFHRAKKNLSVTVYCSKKTFPWFAIDVESYGSFAGWERWDGPGHQAVRRLTWRAALTFFLLAYGETSVTFTRNRWLDDLVIMKSPIFSLCQHFTLLTTISMHILVEHCKQLPQFFTLPGFRPWQCDFVAFLKKGVFLNSSARFVPCSEHEET